MIPKSITLYFNEATHKYTDEYGNPYKSVTTLLGEYGNKFDIERMAENCYRAGLKGNPKYRGKSKQQLINEWKTKSEAACARGNVEHTFLDNSVKTSNGYTQYMSHKKEGTIYTMHDILDNSKLGSIDLDIFYEQGLHLTNPKVFKLLNYLVKDGYKIYSEIGLYHEKAFISGMTDLPVFKGKKFRVIDWKTNEAPIRYESGYWEKDNYGKLTTNFINTNTMMKYPISYLADSVGNKYTLQTSMYAYLIERFGFECEGNIIVHIQMDEYGNKTETFIPNQYLKHECELLVEDRQSSLLVNNQYSITKN